MKYFVVKTFFDLKRKKHIIIFSLILFFILEVWVQRIQTNSNAITSAIYYGGTTYKDNHLLFYLLKTLKVVFPSYIYFYLLTCDTSYNLTNVFLRMSKKKWFCKKSITLIFLTIFMKFGIYILYISFYKKLPDFLFVISDLSITLGILGCSFMLICSCGSIYKKFFALFSLILLVGFFFGSGYQLFYIPLFIIFLGYIAQLFSLR